MSQTFRIAVLPMYEPGFVPTTVDSQAVDEMFIANRAREDVGESGHLSRTEAD